MLSGKLRSPRGMEVNDTHFCMVEYEGNQRPYRIFFPSSYVHAPTDPKGEVKKFPLVIACHPAGGDETSYFEWRGNADRIQTIAEERGYVVACPALPPVELKEGRYVEAIVDAHIPEMIMAMVSEIKRQRQIDESRIYLMGASKGALSTYATTAVNTDTFAAIAGVCGTFKDEQVEALAKTPMLMYNATRDKRFTIEKARDLVQKVTAAGGEAKLVEVEGGHGGYRDMKSYNIIFDWFDAHRREAAKKAEGQE